MPLTPLEAATKNCIITAGVIVGETPDSLLDAYELVNNLLYNDNKYNLLCVELQALVAATKPAAQLNCNDVAACETVKDVVDLVNNTITRP